MGGEIGVGDHLRTVEQRGNRSGRNCCDVSTTVDVIDFDSVSDQAQILLIFPELTLILQALEGRICMVERDHNIIGNSYDDCVVSFIAGTC